MMKDGCAGGWVALPVRKTARRKLATFFCATDGSPRRDGAAFGAAIGRGAEVVAAVLAKPDALAGGAAAALDEPDPPRGGGDGEPGGDVRERDDEQAGVEAVDPGVSE